MVILHHQLPFNNFTNFSLVRNIFHNDSGWYNKVDDSRLLFKFCSRSLICCICIGFVIAYQLGPCNSFTYTDEAKCLIEIVNHVLFPL